MSDRRTLSIADGTGHTVLAWTPTSTEAAVLAAADAVIDEALAEKAFRDAKAKGYLAYSKGDGGPDSAEVIRTFDPAADIVMMPQTVGG
jgi:hypothetical protein